MKMVDNAVSISIMISNWGGSSSLLKDSLIMGESPNNTQCGGHIGIRLSSSTSGGQSIPPNLIFLPYWKIMSYSSWSQEHFVDNVRFKV